MDNNRLLLQIVNFVSYRILKHDWLLCLLMTIILFAYSQAIFLPKYLNLILFISIATIYFLSAFTEAYGADYKSFYRFIYRLSAFGSSVIVVAILLFINGGIGNKIFFYIGGSVLLLPLCYAIIYYIKYKPTSRILIFIVRCFWMVLIVAIYIMQIY